jgi:F-type H+-transporting ATPase subunit delta
LAQTSKTFGEIAERYAAALFDIVRDAGTIEDAVSDFSALRDALEASSELAATLANPVIDAETKARILAALSAKGGFSGPVSNFLGVLGKNGRAAELRDILGAFARRVADHKGVVSAIVTSAHPLSADQRQAVRDVISKKIGKSVDIEESVDPGLLGGLVIQVGSTLFDNSLRSKLGGMVAAMKGA